MFPKSALHGVGCVYTQHEIGLFLQLFVAHESWALSANSTVLDTPSSIPLHSSLIRRTFKCCYKLPFTLHKVKPDANSEQVFLKTTVHAFKEHRIIDVSQDFAGACADGQRTVGPLYGARTYLLVLLVLALVGACAAVACGVSLWFQFSIRDTPRDTHTAQQPVFEPSIVSTETAGRFEYVQDIGGYGLSESKESFFTHESKQLPQ